MHTFDAPACLKFMEETCLEAGALIRAMQQGDFAVDYKGENDPVTEIDHAVNKLLYDRLHGYMPEFGWLSEETAEDPKWLKKPAAWIVDPIDGTSNMLKGGREFSVSIALVARGEPILAAVYSPVFEGDKDDLISGGRFGIGLRHNGASVTPGHDHVPPRIILSHGSKLSDYFADRGYAPVHFGSIAYRLANCGLGRADVAIGLRHDGNPWDIAAGHLLAELGHCPLTDLNGRAIHYNRVGQKINGFVAVPNDMRPRLLDQLRELTEKIGRKTMPDTNEADA